jgi:hypothetical protein
VIRFSSFICYMTLETIKQMSDGLPVSVSAAACRLLTDAARSQGLSRSELRRRAAPAYIKAHPAAEERPPR